MDEFPSLHDVYNDLVESYQGNVLIALVLRIFRPMLMLCIAPIWGTIAWWSFWFHLWMRLVHIWIGGVTFVFTPLRAATTLVFGGMSFCSHLTMFWSTDNLLDGVFSVPASLNNMWDDLWRGSLYDRFRGLYEAKKQELTQRLSTLSRLPYRVLEIPSLMFIARLQRLSLHDCTLYIQTAKNKAWSSLTNTTSTVLAVPSLARTKLNNFMACLHHTVDSLQGIWGSLSTQNLLRLPAWIRLWCMTTVMQLVWNRTISASIRRMQDIRLRLIHAPVSFVARVQRLSLHNCAQYIQSAPNHAWYTITNSATTVLAVPSLARTRFNNSMASFHHSVDSLQGIWGSLSTQNLLSMPGWNCLWCMTTIMKWVWNRIILASVSRLYDTRRFLIDEPVNNARHTANVVHELGDQLFGRIYFRANESRIVIQSYSQLPPDIILLMIQDHIRSNRHVRHIRQWLSENAEFPIVLRDMVRRSVSNLTLGLVDGVVSIHDSEDGDHRVRSRSDPTHERRSARRQNRVL